MPVRRIVFELSFQASGPREVLRSGTDLQFKCFAQMPAAAVPRNWNPSACANLESNFPFIRQLMSVDISLGAGPTQLTVCVSIGTPLFSLRNWIVSTFGLWKFVSDRCRRNFLICVSSGIPIHRVRPVDNKLGSLPAQFHYLCF